MKIKQLKEKTIKGFIDFLPKVVVDNIEGLSDILNDKLSKSQGGEIKKPIVVTNDDSNYKTIINPDGSIYVLNKDTNNNVFSLINTDEGVIINNNVYSPIRVNNINYLFDKDGNILYDGISNFFYANGFTINNGNDNQILLGDGSTTSKVVSRISAHTETDAYIVNILNIDGAHDSFTILGATKELAGLMTANDKAKFDDIDKTYLPLSGGKLTGPLDIDFEKGIRSIEHDSNPRNTYICNGKIEIESLDGDTRRVNSKTAIDSNSITTTNVTAIGKVKASGFLANNKGNGYTVWATNGGSIDLLNLFSYAAIYVSGALEGAKSNINNTTVINNPDRIICNDTGRFLAEKDSVYYTRWNAELSKDIAPTSRYGIETNEGVFPFNNQLYYFSDTEDTYYAVCVIDVCYMQRITVELHSNE